MKKLFLNYLLNELIFSRISFKFNAEAKKTQFKSFHESPVNLILEDLK